MSHVYFADDAVDRVIESPSPPSSPEPRSEKTVQFDLDPKGPSRQASPNGSKHVDSDNDKARVRSDDAGKERDRHHDGDKRRRRRKDDERSDGTRESGRRRKRHHRDRDESPGSDNSDATIELPPRFDEHGRERPADPMADKLEQVLMGLFAKR